MRYALNADGTSALPAPGIFLTSAGTRGNVRFQSKDSSFQMRLGVPHRAGIIGKRVRIPRGRATVKVVAGKATMQKPGDLPGRRLQLSNAPRKGVQAAVGILFSEKDPVASLSLLPDRKVTGFCFFKRLWSAPTTAALWIHRTVQSGVALRLPPHSKLYRSRRSSS